MTSRQVGRVNQQSKGETPLVSGVLQRAAVRAVADKEGEATQEVESERLNQSRFVHDFSQVSIGRGGLPKEASKTPNQTGLPDHLKAGVENLSGYSLDDVKVHYNSPKPAQLQALAYTQGTEIHVAPGQEEHIPHEAWHVVQQMQGRVKPTKEQNGVQINEEEGLEKEADVLGRKAIQASRGKALSAKTTNRDAQTYHPDSNEVPYARQYLSRSNAPVQRLIGFEIEASRIPVTKFTNDIESVRNFLTKGMQEKKQVDKKPTWSRVTDHGIIGQHIDKERENWQTEATANKDELAKPKHKAAIVEYVTSPFSEIEDQTTKTVDGDNIYGLKEMGSTIGQIQKEIDKIRNQNMATICKDFQVGLPSVNYWFEAAQFYNIKDALSFSKAAREKLKKEVDKNELYVQATVGILPEKISQFLEKAADKEAPYNKMAAISAEDSRLSSKTGNATELIGKMMQRVAQEAPLLTKQITIEGGERATGKDEEKLALQGYLTLVLHVTLGCVINRHKTIGGVAKNMVSFLPKTSLDLIPSALPNPVRTDLLYQNNKAGFKTLSNKVFQVHQKIGEELKNIESKITDEEIKNTDGYALNTTVENYLDEVLSGRKDRFFIDQSAGSDPIKPESPDRGGRTGIQTGGKKHKTTRAIALETRHFAKLISTEQLPDFANNIKDLVIEAHSTV